MNKIKKETEPLGVYYEIQGEEGTVTFLKHLKLGIDAQTGKPVRANIRAKSEKELKLKISRKLHQFKKSQEPKNQDDMMFEELLRLWFESFKPTVRERTAYATWRTLDNYLLTEFGQLKVMEMTTARIQEAINKWVANALIDNGKKVTDSGKTKDYGLPIGFLKRIFKKGKELGIVKNNPMEQIVVPKNRNKAKKKPQAFTKDEVVALIEGLENHEPYRKNHINSIYRAKLMRVFMYLLLYTGLRTGEALALNWQDIDFVNLKLAISKTTLRNREIQLTTKTEAGVRTIALDKHTTAVLNKWRLYQAEEFMKLGKSRPDLIFVPYGKDLPIGYGEALKDATRIYQENNLPELGLHGLRHTHASLLLNARIPYKEIQMRLGHESIKVTIDKYGHLYEETQKQLLEDFTAYLSR